MTRTGAQLLTALLFQGMRRKRKNGDSFLPELHILFSGMMKKSK